MPNASIQASEGYNYHFWKKYYNGGYWYHKMGTLSAIMSLKSGYTPSTIEINDQYYDGSGTFHNAATYTNSSVIYIAYNSGIYVDEEEEIK